MFCYKIHSNHISTFYIYTVIVLFWVERCLVTEKCACLLCGKSYFRQTFEEESHWYQKSCLASSLTSMPHPVHQTVWIATPQNDYCCTTCATPRESWEVSRCSLLGLWGFCIFLETERTQYNKIKQKWSSYSFQNHCFGHVTGNKLDNKIKQQYCSYSRYKALCRIYNRQQMDKLLKRVVVIYHMFKGKFNIYIQYLLRHWLPLHQQGLL